MNGFVNPMEFDDIDDFIKAIETKYEAKKRNNYDDESQTVTPDGRNQHNNNVDCR